MLIRLTKTCRGRAAGILVALYSLCVLAPTTALAFADPATAAHCLTDDHHMAAKPHSHGAAAAHVHAEGTAHEHSMPQSGDDENGRTSNCCGLMCLFAVPVAFGQAGDEPPPAMPATPKLRQNLPGCAPDLLYRPPISLLSL